MKIVHVITNLTAGGAELMLRRLIEAHSSNPLFNHRVISLIDTSTVGRQLQEAGIPVKALHARSVRDLPRTIWRLYRELQQQLPDVVHCWMYHADLVGGACARAIGTKRVIWGVRTSDIGPHAGIPRTTKLIRRACARLSGSVPAAIVYVAESARIAHERLGYDPAKSIVIPNGYVRLPPGDRGFLRNELGIATDALVVASVGRFAPYKDPKTFVEAAASAAAGARNLQFVMIGRGYVADNAELREWISASGCAERFHLMGERADVARLLAGFDIFCLHSRLEGFPNVVAEAMGAGVPSVVTDVGDARLLVGDAGLVVPPGEPEALADAIVELASRPEAKRGELGLLARERVESRYSIDAISRRYTDLYTSLMDGTEVMARDQSRVHA